jgi:hypothetical protein
MEGARDSDFDNSKRRFVRRGSAKQGDARLERRTTMTEKDIALWTAAIEKDNRSYLTESRS